ncbi:MAG: dephospho-CoA kinase [Hyphomicrobiaceae bacterium]|jgi:dephospho-CoA kinase
MQIILGLTGGIGSGKSTVAALLADRGASVIDADSIAHGIYGPGKPGFDLVVERFGRDVIGEDGHVDRGLLGGKVFGNRAALEDLNRIVHPLVRTEVAERVAELLREDEHAIVVIEAALMTETGWTGGAGALWTVIADPKIATHRLVTLRGMDPDDVRMRMAAQVDNETRKRLASVVIENNAGLEELESTVHRLWSELRDIVC